MVWYGVGPPISGAISKAMKLPHLSLMKLDEAVWMVRHNPMSLKIIQILTVDLPGNGGLDIVFQVNVWEPSFN